MFDLEEICQNCKHWKSAGRYYGVARCAVDAVKPDVGAKAIVILPGNANCKQYDDAFEPDPEYLDYLREAETQNDGL